MVWRRLPEIVIISLIYLILDQLTNSLPQALGLPPVQRAHLAVGIRRVRRSSLCTLLCTLVFPIRGSTMHGEDAGELTLG